MVRLQAEIDSHVALQYRVLKMLVERVAQQAETVECANLAKLLLGDSKQASFIQAIISELQLDQNEAYTST